MKNTMVLAGILAGLCLSQGAMAQQFKLASPNGHLQVQIDNADALRCSILKDGKTIVPTVELALELESGAIPGRNAKISETPERSENETITPAVAIKNATIPNVFHEITLKYENNCSVVFRAYDDAVAYRFETSMPGEIIVKNELVNVNLPQKASAWFAITKNWMNDYQHVYDKQPVGKLGKKITQLPLLVDLGDAGKLMLAESDLRDYPGLYFTGNTSGSLKATLPPAVESEKKNDPANRRWDRVFEPAEAFDYIAKTSGTRTFPWRIFALAEKDTELLNNEIVYKLAEPTPLDDTSWIKPGLVAWDWWNDWNITGVDFRAGVNNDTYKYYIDFAAANGIPYIILDEGWYVLGDIMKQVPEIDVPELVAYGKTKGVDLILWCVWRTLDNKMEEALSQFEQWGIKGIKVDFMNRDDQDVVNFYWRCAKAAAGHHLTVDYHGAHKPAGIQRTYPNVLTFEGFPGLEEVKWSDKTATPEMAVTLPYIRMFPGPMDYTPGAMRNAQKEEFKSIFDYPMSMGTRCQQLAIYVLYDSPLQMLCDNPTAYMKEQESTDFIADMPTTWDKTIPLDGSIGEYIVMARQKGDDFFVGAMTNWDARDLTVDLSFLPEGEYQATIFQDGINADRNGIDYKKVTQTVTKNDKLKIHLAPGGGWAARISK